MTESVEQRIYIKFCFKLGKTATETNDMIKLTFGEDAMSRARVFEWFRRLEKGKKRVRLSLDPDVRLLHAMRT